MSPDAVIDELGYASLYALCCEWLYEPSGHSDIEQLRRSVRDGYWDHDIPAGAIFGAADVARDTLVETANKIIQDNLREAAAIIAEKDATIAAQHARIQELEARPCARLSRS